MTPLYVDLCKVLEDCASVAKLFSAFTDMQSKKLKIDLNCGSLSKTVPTPTVWTRVKP